MLKTVRNWWESLNVMNRERLKFVITASLFWVSVGSTIFIVVTTLIVESDEESEGESKEGNWNALLVPALIGSATTTLFAYNVKMNGVMSRESAEGANAVAKKAMLVEQGERLMDSDFHRNVLEAAVKMYPIVDRVHAQLFEVDEDYGILPKSIKLRRLQKYLPEEIAAAKRRVRDDE